MAQAPFTLPSSFKFSLQQIWAKRLWEEMPSSFYMFTPNTAQSFFFWKRESLNLRWSDYAADLPNGRVTRRGARVTKKNDKRWVMGVQDKYVRWIPESVRLSINEWWRILYDVFFSIGEGEAERWTVLCRTEMDLEYVSKVWVSMRSARFGILNLGFMFISYA